MRDTTDLSRLTRLLEGRRLAVLTGAGISTESGIPDYRGPETRRRARNPIQHRGFVNDPIARARYWARSVVGWPRVAGALPNPGHRALAELEERGEVLGVVTQNVDRLHQKAGSRRVVELHGALAEVVCLDCGALEPREELQERLLALNPAWRVRGGDTAPDGDVDLEARDEEGFVVAGCRRCAGVLKPHVVFFGGSVPKERVEAAFAIVRAADALLVVGSSLAVFSGYRFVRDAATRGQPVAIVNLGESRGDPHAELVVQRRASEALAALVAGTPRV